MSKPTRKFKSGWNHQWFESQQAVVDATAGVPITQILTDTDYDVAWELLDGRVVALEISKASGCPTCGNDGGDHTWWLITRTTP